MYEQDTIRKKIKLFADNLTEDMRIEGPNEYNYRCDCCGAYLKSHWFNDKTEDAKSYDYYWKERLQVRCRWGDYSFRSSVVCAQCHQKINDKAYYLAHVRIQRKMQASIKALKKRLRVVRRMS